jgi:hypothetical protein
VAKTVWYSFTPSVDTRVELSTVVSPVFAVIGVYRGRSVDALSEVACAKHGYETGTLPWYNPFTGLRFEAQAGKRYSIQIGGNPNSPTRAGDLTVRLTAVAAPNEAAPDFAIGTTPQEYGAVVAQGQIGTGIGMDDFITVERYAGYAEPVAISLSGVPDGIDAEMLPGSSADKWYLAFMTRAIVPSGVYVVRVTGTGGAWTRDTYLLLVVDSERPVAGPPVPVFAVGETIPENGLVRVRVDTPVTDNMPQTSSYEYRQTNGGPWGFMNSDWDLVQPGETRAYRGHPYDLGGNPGSVVVGPAIRFQLQQDSSSTLRYRGTWTSREDAAASGGWTRFTKKVGARVTVPFTGRAIAWVTTTGPKRGAAKVYLDGTLVATVDLYDPTMTRRTVAYAFNASSSAAHSLRIVNVASPGRPRIDIDAFATLNDADMPSGDCSDAYPGLCIPPPPPTLNCSDVPYRWFAVRGPDPHGFDGDNDGYGCEQ